MRPRRITIVRHGQSIGNVDRSVYAHTPDWRIPLTEKGRQQAREAGKKLFDELDGQKLTVYVSPYVRAQQTWREMNQFSHQVDIDLKEDIRLREQDIGDIRSFDDKGWDEIEAERAAHGAFFYRFRGGESGACVYNRIDGFIDRMNRVANYHIPALIVTHGYTSQCLAMHLMGLTVEQFEQTVHLRNGEAMTLEWDEERGRYQLLG